MPSFCNPFFCLLLVPFLLHHTGILAVKTPIMAAAAPASGVRLLHPRPWLRSFRRTARPLSILAASLPIQNAEELTTTVAAPEPPTSTNLDKRTTTYYPKRGQTLELVCESLAYKGKGLCKVADTGFVVMCDRALPGEKFIGRVTRKKDNYAEVYYLFTACGFFHLIIPVVSGFSSCKPLGFCRASTCLPMLFIYFLLSLCGLAWMVVVYLETAGYAFICLYNVLVIIFLTLCICVMVLYVLNLCDERSLLI